ncbi:hypothetical protein MUP35_01915 [Patescibacteria group bacterium]|nr:hypothetical protein [Patescibacteria group bacterium]
MSNYNSGRNYEYKAVEELQQEGYSAQRFAGSHSSFDVLAFNELVIRLIQVKSTEKDLDFKNEIAEMEKIKVPPCCNKELWVWKKGGKHFFKTIIRNPIQDWA